ncbi:MAG: hypothetical protein WD767_10355 [Alphaproteobacteria bacterium]
MNRPNGRHELFCREYVRRPVGSAAAVAAGYGADNAAAQACRLLALEQNQLNTALRAVAMQVKVSEATPAWRKGARPAQPARPAAAPDLDAMLAALEASLPPEVTAQGEAPGHARRAIPGLARRTFPGPSARAGCRPRAGNAAGSAPRIADKCP